VSTYEIVAIVRPDLDEDALNAAIERIHQRITEIGGTVTSTDRWGKRRTSYPIQNFRDGFYVMTVFTLDSGQVGRLRQTLGLHEELLRLTVSTHHPAPAPTAPAPQPAPPAAAAVPAAPAPAAPTVAEGAPPAPPSGASNV